MKRLWSLWCRLTGHHWRAALRVQRGEDQAAFYRVCDRCGLMVSTHSRSTTRDRVWP